MSEQSDFFKKHATSLATGFSLILLIYGVRHRAKIMEKLRYVWDFRNPLRHKRIEIVDTVDDCQRIVNALKLQTSSYKVVGFDCEWVTVGGSRRPVALLQLATHEGLCALFRLCHLQHIPKPLRELLEDESLLKVGVSPLDDAKKLCSDYGVGVASTFDLRFLAAMTGNKAEGLAKLSKSVLKVQLDKNWRLVCSDWESMVLSERQLHYAANDALVAVEIFHKLALNLEPRHFWELGKLNVESIKDRLESLYDVNFKGGYVQTLSEQSNGVSKAKKSSSSSSLLSEAGQQQLQQKRNASTRSRTLYDNCLLRAPDDELLCTIDYRKAQWYIRLDLGEKTCDDPFTVRLKFEPAGRAKGDPGEYYQTPKENQCVVCGRRDSYNRKNIVPREYRKYFPTVMKNHTSHDILLLCPQCHQMSDLSNLQVRERLAVQCQAPFKYTAEENRFREDQTLKKVKSAARALASNYDRIPKPKRDMLEDVVKQHLGVESLTMEQIKEATNLNDRIENENFCDHGYKVVQAYQNEFGGLVELEKLWRQHFLDSMHPKFMPALWNVNHNANRLEIRAKEGRVTSQELQYAGLNIPVEERQVPQRERIARCEEPVNVEN